MIMTTKEALMPMPAFVSIGMEGEIEGEACTERPADLVGGVKEEEEEEEDDDLRRKLVASVLECERCRVAVLAENSMVVMIFPTLDNRNLPTPVSQQSRV